MAIPKFNALNSASEIIGGKPVAGATDSVHTNSTRVGWWWSEVDWQWWPVTLGEVREASGQAGMTLDQGRNYVKANWGLDLRLTIPHNKSRPTEETMRSTSTGRVEAPSGGGRGRGRGSGAIAPTFIPQDPATIREQVRNYVVNVTGTSNEELIDMGVAEFQSKNKSAFASAKTKQIDPWQAMKERIRTTAAYRAVNAGRPDSVDELDWVSSKQSRLRQLGLSASTAERVGINAAISGTAEGGLVEAAEATSVLDTGRLLTSQRNALKQSASSAVRLL